MAADPQSSVGGRRSDVAPSFGFVIPQAAALRDGRLEIDEITRLVVHAEGLGYRELVVADHVLMPANWGMRLGNKFVDAFTLLAYLAAVTTELRLVLGCLVVPYRHPLVSAKAIATLDQLSKGRMAMGVVPGYLRAEFEALGVPFGDRLAMTDEYIHAMRTAWTDEHATHRGRFAPFDDWDLVPKCVQQPHVPIWVGGASKGALKRAITVGAVWHPLGFVVLPDDFMAVHADAFAGETMQTDDMTPARLAAALRDARVTADQVGRDLATLEVVVAAGRHPTYLRGPERDRFVALLDAYVEAGATGFIMSLGGTTVDECERSLDDIAKVVMPNYR